MSIFNENDKVLSFGIVSDTHITGNENDMNCRKLTEAMGRILSFRDTAPDAVCFVGDMLNSGKEHEAAQFTDIVSSTVGQHPETGIFYCIGNHEHFASPYAEIAKTSLCRFFDEKCKKQAYGNDIGGSPLTGNRHAVICGYHFISVEPDTYTAGKKKFSDETLEWFENTLSEASADAPEQYIFVLTHAMVYDTCYGSDLQGPNSMWNTTELTEILKKFPRVIIFGGHLHFPLNDERSIMQKDFTSIGTASVSYMAIENGCYENMRSATVMNDCNEFSQGMYIEADRKGNLKISKLDFYNGGTIKKPWYLPSPDDGTDYLGVYSEKRADMYHAPEIGEMSVSVSEDGAVLGFSSAVSDDIVHHYEISVSAGNEKSAFFKILADFYRHTDPSEMKDRWTQNLGIYEAGTELCVTLKAVTSWGKASEKTIKAIV